MREAALLTSTAVTDLSGMEKAARRLADRGARVVVVKGGHLAGDQAPDVVLADGVLTVLEGPRVVSANDHGTGCTLSSAIAARLASGEELHDAIREAKEYVARAIGDAATWTLGAGHGPLDHFGARRAVAARTTFAVTPGTAPAFSPRARALRVLHSTIGVFELGCLGHVWLCAVTRRRGRLFRLAVGVLGAEGLALVAARGCPLGYLPAPSRGRRPHVRAVVRAAPCSVRHPHIHRRRRRRTRPRPRPAPREQWRSPPPAIGSPLCAIDGPASWASSSSVPSCSSAPLRPPGPHPRPRRRPTSMPSSPGTRPSWTPRGSCSPGTGPDRTSATTRCCDSAGTSSSTRSPINREPGSRPTSSIRCTTARPSRGRTGRATRR